jgi:hypothetical protein
MRRKSDEKTSMLITQTMGSKRGKTSSRQWQRLPRQASLAEEVPGFHQVVVFRVVGGQSHQVNTGESPSRLVVKDVHWDSVIHLIVELVQGHGFHARWIVVAWLRQESQSAVTHWTHVAEAV